MNNWMANHSSCCSNILARTSMLTIAPPTMPPVAAVSMVSCTKSVESSSQSQAASVEAQYEAKIANLKEQSQYFLAQQKAELEKYFILNILKVLGEEVGVALMMLEAH